MPVSEGMWESIEAQIPVKKEKPKYWMLLLVMLFALPFLLYPLSKSGEQNAEMQPDSERIIDTADNSNSNNSNTNNNDSNNSTTSLDRSELAELGAEKSVTVFKTQSNSNSVPSSNTTIEDQENKNSIQTSSTKRINQQAATTISGSTKPVDNSSLGKTLNSLVSPILSEAESSGFNSSNSKKKLKFLKKPIAASTDSEGSTSSNNFKLIEKLRVFQSATTLKRATAIGNIFNENSFSLINYDRQEDIGRLLRLKKASPVCPSFQTFRSGIYFYADYRAGLVNQQLENKSNNQEIDDLITQRNRTESGALSTSINLGIGKKWNSGVLLESGLNFDAITTTLSYLQPGGTIIVIDSMPPITMDTISTSAQMVNSKNRFRQLNIPVNLGYEITLNERYSIAAKAGVLVNLSSSNSGQIVDNNGLLAYDSSDRINSLYKTNLNLSYTGGIDFLVEATQNISGYVGLSVNYYPDDFSLSTYAIRQSYYKYGMTAGLRYRL